MFRDEYSSRYVGRNIAGSRVYAQLFEHYQTNVTCRITLDSLAKFLPETILRDERLSDIRGCGIASGRYYQDRSWALHRYSDPNKTHSFREQSPLGLRSPYWEKGEIQQIVLETRFKSLP